MSIFQNNLTELAWTHDLDNIFKYFDNYFNIINDYKSEKIQEQLSLLSENESQN